MILFLGKEFSTVLKIKIVIFHSWNLKLEIWNFFFKHVPFQKLFACMLVKPNFFVKPKSYQP